VKAAHSEGLPQTGEAGDASDLVCCSWFLVSKAAALANLTAYMATGAHFLYVKQSEKFWLAHSLPPTPMIPTIPTTGIRVLNG
jgi:hypothetical protein